MKYAACHIFCQISGGKGGNRGYERHGIAWEKGDKRKTRDKRDKRDERNKRDKRGKRDKENMTDCLIDNFPQRRAVAIFAMFNHSLNH